MDDATHLLLEEWKARYESYRLYRQQYLTTMSVAATAIAVIVGLAFQAKIPIEGRRALLGIACVIAFGLLVAHLLARKAIRDLGERLRTLEDSMEFKPFQTSWMLEMALSYTQWISLFALFGLIFLFVIAWNHV